MLDPGKGTSEDSGRPALLRYPSRVFVLLGSALLAGESLPAAPQKPDVVQAEKAPHPRAIEFPRPAWSRPLSAEEIIRLGPVALQSLDELRRSGTHVDPLRKAMLVIGSRNPDECLKLADKAARDPDGMFAVIGAWSNDPIKYKTQLGRGLIPGVAADAAGMASLYSPLVGLFALEKLENEKLIDRKSLLTHAESAYRSAARHDPAAVFFFRDLHAATFTDPEISRRIDQEALRQLRKNGPEAVVLYAQKHISVLPPDERRSLLLEIAPHYPQFFLTNSGSPDLGLTAQARTDIAAKALAIFCRDFEKLLTNEGARSSNVTMRRFRLEGIYDHLEQLEKATTFKALLPELMKINPEESLKAYNVLSKKPGFETGAALLYKSIVNDEPYLIRDHPENFAKLCKTCGKRPVDAVRAVALESPIIAAEALFGDKLGIEKEAAGKILQTIVEVSHKDPVRHVDALRLRSKLKEYGFDETRFVERIIASGSIQFLNVPKELLPQGYLARAADIRPDRIAAAFSEVKEISDDEKVWVGKANVIRASAGRFTAAQTNRERSEVVARELKSLLTVKEAAALDGALARLNTAVNGTFAVKAITDFPHPDIYEDAETIPNHQLVFMENNPIRSRRFDVGYISLQAACAKGQDAAFTFLTRALEANEEVLAKAANVRPLEEALQGRRIGGSDTVVHIVTVGFKDSTLGTMARRAKEWADTGASIAGVNTEYAPDFLRELRKRGVKDLPPVSHVTKNEILNGMRKTLTDAVLSGKKHVVLNIEMHGTQAKGDLVAIDGELSGADMHSVLTTRVNSPGSPYHGKAVCSILDITLLSESCFYGKLSQEFIDNRMLKEPLPIKDLLTIGISPDAQPAVVTTGRRLSAAFDPKTADETLSIFVGYLLMPIKDTSGSEPNLGAKIRFAWTNAFYDSTGMERALIVHVRDSDGKRHVTTEKGSRAISR